MSRSLACLLLGLLSSAAPVAAADVGKREREPHRDFGGVREFVGRTYSVDNGYRPLHADVFMPLHAARPAPILVYLHGGGWTLDPQGHEGVTGEEALAALARRGFVVVRPEYRLSGEAKFPAQLIDVKRAVRWARTYAADWGGDPRHVSAWGASAGGNLAALLGVTCGLAKFEPPDVLPKRVGLSTPTLDPGASSCVDAVVDWYGPVDFPRMDSQALAGSPLSHDAADSAESELVGCAIQSCPPETVAAASPLTYVTAKAPPFLIMHGRSDHAVPWQQSQELYTALRAKGVQAELVLVPGADHMFDGASDAVRRDVFDRAVEFLKR